MSKLTFSSWRLRHQWAYEASKCSILLCGGLELLHGMKGRNSHFYPQKPATWAQEDSPPARFLPLCIWERRVAEGLRKPRKSLMSPGIISVYESSSDFAQIPFHSSKKWIFPAQEEKKMFNATWQARHPVCSSVCSTLSAELMPRVSPVLLPPVTSQWRRQDLERTVPQQARRRSYLEPSM